MKIQSHIRHKIIPALPSALHLPVQNALEKDRLRRMPNSFLPAIMQGGHRSKEGVILIGDAWNMRHPLTGGMYLSSLSFYISHFILSGNDCSVERCCSAKPTSPLFS